LRQILIPDWGQKPLLLSVVHRLVARQIEENEIRALSGRVEGAVYLPVHDGTRRTGRACHARRWLPRAQTALQSADPVCTKSCSISSSSSSRNITARKRHDDGAIPAVYLMAVLKRFIQCTWEKTKE